MSGQTPIGLVNASPLTRRYVEELQAEIERLRKEKRVVQEKLQAVIDSVGYMLTDEERQALEGDK